MGITYALEQPLEAVEALVNQVCSPLGIRSVVLEYEEYRSRKQSLLQGHTKMRFPTALAWLYDPDSWRQDLLPGEDWGNPYRYVVILESASNDALSKAAHQILDLGTQVGLILF